MSSGFDPVPSDRLEITSEVGAALTDFDYRIAASILKITHALRWPKDTISYLTERIGLEGFQIPVTQLSGFTQFTANAATKIATNESTTSATYTNLDTSGPTLTGLPDGKYLVLFGAYFRIAAVTDVATMSVKINATEAVDADAAQWNLTNGGSGSMAMLATLSSADNNTLLARYRTNGISTAFFADRWMIALKYASL